MPRAIGAFRAVGFEVEPWPVLERAPRDQKAALLFHEIAGLFVYRILGRSAAFYPGPVTAGRGWKLPAARQIETFGLDLVRVNL